MEERGDMEGRVVTAAQLGFCVRLGSCVGERMMTPGLVSYSATKGAVKMFTEGLSREAGPHTSVIGEICAICGYLFPNAA